MSRSTIISMMLVGLFLASTDSCRTQSPPAPLPTAVPTIDILTIGISDTATDLANMLETTYEGIAPHIRLIFVPGNDEVLHSDLHAGLLDALLVHHVEKDATAWYNPVAVDGLVLIVHPDNPVSDLSLGEVEAIFRGQLTNWKSLSGPDLSIEPVVREDGSGASEIFLERIMTEHQTFVNALVAPSDPFMLELVEDKIGSIGYTMMGNSNKASVLSLEGTAPTVTTVTEQSYPLTVPIYFVSLREPDGQLRAFLAWLQAPDGQMILGDSYGRVR